MAPVQMMSTNAVMDSASLYSMPVMITMTVETSQMSLAVVSDITKVDIPNIKYNFIHQ